MNPNSLTVHDNGEIFRVEGCRMTLARGVILPARWTELPVSWKLDALQFLTEYGLFPERSTDL